MGKELFMMKDKSVPSAFESIFEAYNKRYESILDVLYPSKNNTGFTERNLSVNFAAAYEAAHPGSVTWYEFQFGKRIISIWML